MKGGWMVVKMAENWVVCWADNWDVGKAVQRVEH
jgi:hypothetical protein